MTLRWREMDSNYRSPVSIAALEQRKLEYVLGVRERSSAEVRRHRD